MSVVTGITLQFSVAEEFSELNGEKDVFTLVEEINEWLAHRNFGPLASVEDAYGGNKHPQFCVCGGGYNYFPDDEFCSFVLSRPWGYPKDVILLVKHEDDPIKIMQPTSGECISSAPLK